MNGTIKPLGLYPGIIRRDYETAIGVNQSLLKQMRRSPAHARHWRDHPPSPSQEMEFGTALHTLVLNGEEDFRREYAVVPKIDKRYKEGKERWAAFQMENIGKRLLEMDDFDRLQAMDAALSAHATAGALLREAGQMELGVFWQDASTGIMCKALLDKVTRFGDYTVIVDLKTTANASSRAFALDVHKYGYHLQAAFYLEGLCAQAPAHRRFMFIAVEKEPPFAVAVYELDEASLEQGARECATYLQHYATCMERNVWPAYDASFQTISLPVWALERDE